MAWSPTAVQTEGLFVTESPIPDKVLINVPSVAESDNSEGDIVNTMALLPKNTVRLTDRYSPSIPLYCSNPNRTSCTPRNLSINVFVLNVQVVRISGNNRTKAALVGQKAIVRRSIGLGGWHWLVRNMNLTLHFRHTSIAVYLRDISCPTVEPVDFGRCDTDPFLRYVNCNRSCPRGKKLSSSAMLCLYWSILLTMNR